jgi:hybrid cluster-associated redox disulfide protein
MDMSTIHILLTVEQVLQKWPQAFSIFMKNKTKCPGCLMQHFCTLKDVAETYQIPLDKLMVEIEKMSNEEIISKGASYENSV